MKISLCLFLFCVCWSSQVYTQDTLTVNGETTLCSGSSIALTACDEITPTIFDVENNSASSIFQVTVNDTLAPIALYKDITINLNKLALATLDATTIVSNSSDNYTINTMSNTQDTFDCSDLGMTTPVALTVFDEENNSSTCISQVTIDDVQYNGQLKVLNPNNDGSEPLRQVISDACPEDVIFFQNNLQGHTIKLESPILFIEVI